MLNDKMGVAESETIVKALAQTPLKGKPESVVHTLAYTLAKKKARHLATH